MLAAQSVFIEAALAQRVKGGSVDVEDIDVVGEGGTAEEALERDGRWTGEMDFKRADGTQSYCESVVAPLRDAEGRTIAHIRDSLESDMRALMFPAGK